MHEWPSNRDQIARAVAKASRPGCCLLRTNTHLFCPTRRAKRTPKPTQLSSLTDRKSSLFRADKLPVGRVRRAIGGVSGPTAKRKASVHNILTWAGKLRQANACRCASEDRAKAFANTGEGPFPTRHSVFERCATEADHAQNPACNANHTPVRTVHN